MTIGAANSALYYNPQGGDEIHTNKWGHCAHRSPWKTARCPCDGISEYRWSFR